MEEGNYFNPATYMVIDRITGEEVPMDVFIEEASNGYWEKTYAKTLSDYIGVTGDACCKVLAHLVKQKSIYNMVNGTLLEIAKESGTHHKTVKNIFNILIEKGMLKKVRNGCYFLSPHILRHGGKTRGAIMIRAWHEIG